MPVGDVTSNEPGSGARYNDGKVDLTLLPPACWDLIATEHYLELDEFGYRYELDRLMAFWEGDDDAIHELMDTVDPEDLIGAAKVFAYGAKKYAKWNWAKGMPWSVPMACYLRHMLLADPCGSDAESGLSHRYHAVCNLIMLAHYVVLCRDLDDRPAELTPAFHSKIPLVRKTWQEKLLQEESPEEAMNRIRCKLFDDLVVKGCAAWRMEPVDLHAAVDFASGPDEAAFWVGYRTDEGYRTELLGNLTTSVLNELVEQAVEEQESRERTLRATGQLRGGY
jgi:hypothetical protein